VTAGLRNERDGKAASTALSMRALVTEMIGRCPAGTPFDARAVIDEHPELLNHKSALLELAYEDFCRRDDLGIPVAPDEFVARFPTISRSLLHQIEVHRLLADSAPAPTSPADSPWPAPGHAWLDFQLLEELGRGAYSRVYLAREKSLGDRLVVVKATSLGPREAHTLGMLQHPHIVPVHSMQRDEQRGLTAVCMPFLSRVSLFDVMDALFSAPRAPARAAVMLDAVRRLNAAAGTVPEVAVESGWPRGWSHDEAVLSIGIQVAQALRHAHQQGVRHGDVKPSNVLLTNSGRAVLLDFNLAILGDESAAFVAGTLPYMAPEQLHRLAQRASPAANGVDERADIFSLGMTLFELLTGRPPFGPLPPENSRERLARQLLDRYGDGPEKAHGPSRGQDGSVRKILERCLEFDPACRPQSMDELEGLFRAQLKRTQRVRRWLRLHRRPVIGAAVLVVAGLLGIAGWQASREPYPVREWHKGEAAFKREDYAGAAVNLTRALEHDPQMREARFLRALARFRERDLGGAYDDLSLLCREPSDGRPRAALAHVVFVREEKCGVAAAHYRQAVQEGCRSALIYNNLGHCLFKIVNLPEAEKALRSACLLDPDMGAAYHNLAQLEIQRTVLSQWRHRPDPASIEKAMELGPASSELYLDGGCIYALCARTAKTADEREAYVKRAFDALERGFAYGLTPKHLDEVAGLNPRLTECDRWRDLLARPRSNRPFTRAVLMFDPLPQLGSGQVSNTSTVASR
jgi:serine/threonine protein kinase/Tfp pilus assembly protein PilF